MAYHGFFFFAMAVCGTPWMCAERHGCAWYAMDVVVPVRHSKKSNHAKTIDATTIHGKKLIHGRAMAVSSTPWMSTEHHGCVW